MPRIRPASTSDTPEIVRVIRAVYDEYGFSWDPDSYHADLYDLDAHYFQRGFSFWVAELEGRVQGTAALELFSPVPGTPGALVQMGEFRRISGTDCALQRLYVHPEARRAGLGTALFEATLSEARARRCAAMEIWSDKRFEDAHRLYGRYAAATVGDRVCHDPDQSPEWGLYLPLEAR